MKRAQISSQMLMMVFGLIVVASIIMVGYYAVGAAARSGKEMQLTRLQSTMKADFQSLSSEFGSEKNLKYDLPDEFREICLIDSSRKNEILDSGIISNYPLISSELDTDNNVFLVKDRMDMVSFQIPDVRIDRYPYMICQPPGSVISIRGDRPYTSVDPDFSSSIMMDDDAWTQLESVDGILTIELPPSSGEELFTIDISGAGSVSDTYTFAPSMTFSEPAILKMKYDPARVGQCPEVLVFAIRVGPDKDEHVARRSDGSIDCVSKEAVFRISRV